MSDHITLPLTKGFEVVIDAVDYEWLSQWKWTYSHGYAIRTVNTGKVDGKYKYKRVYMHRELLLPPDGRVVDHINGDSLDNRRSNLRIATRGQNAVNSGAKGATSIYRGVYRSKGSKSWIARIKVNYKGVHLGCFSTEIEATKAYNEAALKYFGSFARLNNI